MIIISIVFKVSYGSCESEPDHSADNGLLTFTFDELNPGKDKIISAHLKDCR